MNYTILIILVIIIIIFITSIHLYYVNQKQKIQSRINIINSKYNKQRYFKKISENSEYKTKKNVRMHEYVYD